MIDTCACCGVVIPEGRQVCPKCDSWSAAPDAFLPDGTPLYLKVPTRRADYPSLQLAIYDLLNRRD